MSFPEVSHAHMRLTFHEANILMENLRDQDKAGFIARLQNLSRHTTDPFLRRELSSLNSKVLELSEEEFTILREDVRKGKVLFPPNYDLPYFTL